MKNKKINKWLILVFGLSASLFSWTKQAVCEGQSYEKISIIGEIAELGVYDPSVEYDRNGVGYLVYSACEKAGYAHTHLAKSTDQGRTWQKIKEINKTEEGSLTTKVLLKERTTQGAWRHETPSLVYDPDDPDENKRWKLFWIKGFSKPPHRSPLSNIWNSALVMYKYASSPEGLAQAQAISLFDVKALNNVHPKPINFSFFMEPGAIAKDGVLYLSLHAVGKKGEIFLLSSKDSGNSWKYIDTLTTEDDARALGYDAFTASSLSEESGRLFLLVSPTKRASFPLPHSSYNGIYIFEFEDIAQGKLKRDSTGKLIVHKDIKPISTASVGGGQSDYHSQNTYGGIIMAQSAPTAPKERFQIYSTKEKIEINSKILEE